MLLRRGDCHGTRVGIALTWRWRRHNWRWVLLWLCELPWWRDGDLLVREVVCSRLQVLGDVHECVVVEILLHLRCENPAMVDANLWAV